MQYRAITLENTDGLAVITLNRPERMNSLNTQMRAEILDAFKSMSTQTRVIVLTGAAPAFCAGQDLADGGNAADLDLEAVLRDEYVPMLEAIFDCPVPTIAAVNGAAVGAGANLALACDVVMASESAYFSQAFTKIALIPDAGGTYYLPRQIGLARAMGAALFADTISASQARDWGMIYETAPDADFEAHWRKRARHLANGPSKTYGLVKEALRASLSNTLDQQLALEARLQGEAGKTRDFREGVQAFLEKRAPKFEGR